MRDTDKLEWLEKAVAQGEPVAMTMLADSLTTEDAEGLNRSRANALLRAAAELGEEWAQIHYAMSFCDRESVERYVWLRRSAIQGGGNNGVDDALC